MKTQKLSLLILSISLFALSACSDLSVKPQAAVYKGQPVISQNASEKTAPVPGIVAAYKAREAIVAGFKALATTNQYAPQAAIYKGQPTPIGAALDTGALAGLCSNPLPSCLISIQWLLWSTNMGC